MGGKMAKKNGKMGGKKSLTILEIQQFFKTKNEGKILSCFISDSFLVLEPFYGAYR